MKLIIEYYANVEKPIPILSEKHSYVYNYEASISYIKCL